MLGVIVGEDSLLWQVLSQSTFSSFTAMLPLSPAFCVWVKTQSNKLRSELT